MADIKLSIPLAFLVALGVSGSASAVSDLGTDDLQALQPGSLKGLLADDKAQLTETRPAEIHPRPPSSQMTQWFNGSFNSCIQGYWRRC
ncbi:hypothetical protein JQ561_34250 [Bradyrhizobium diazoefficiens]|nr:hypothetical protein [Bradyrhizobium diazoefficiens]MBR0931700.1 hypothetical protein [Bradyrhizobium diazoefficiens]